MISARILVVEDDTKIAAILVDYLQQAGLTAEVKRDGQRSAERVRQSAPDCILLDLSLPGLGVCRVWDRRLQTDSRFLRRSNCDDYGARRRD